MKKVSIAFVLVIISTLNTRAQNVAIGLKAGVTASNMKFLGDGYGLSLETKTGFYAGVFADVSVLPHVTISPGLYYSLLGANYSDDDNSPKLDMGYINLPILAKYKRDGLSLFLGPQISYLVAANYKSGSETNDVKEEHKSTNFSGIIGAGYTLNNGVGLDVRYQFGLSDVLKDNNSGGTLKNNSFMFGIHYVLLK